MSEDFALRSQLLDLYAAYASCVDDGRFDEWVDLFTDDCCYKVIPRENHEKGYPLALISLDSKGLLRDRVYAIQSTLFHAPYYQRHIVGVPRLISREGDLIVSEANYLVIRTKRDEPGDLFNAGRYLDRIRIVDGTLKFVERLCVYDTDLIPNSLIYPI
jgi:salicylate 5-hydroxylase small subunit